MDPSQREFLIDELKGLREKVSVAVGDARALERYALVVTGGVWAWLLAHEGDLPRLSWWIPCFLVCLMVLREGVLYLEIRDLARYIRHVETLLLGSDVLIPPVPGGWENHLQAWKLGPQKLRVPGAALAFWAALTLGTLLGPFWLASR